MQRNIVFPEFRYLISGASQYLIGVSIRENVLSFYQLTTSGEIAYKFDDCATAYKKAYPGVSFVFQKDPMHGHYHSAQYQEIEVTHTHVRHSNVISLSRLHELLSHFKKCNNDSPKVLTDEVIKDIKNHYKIFCAKMQKGELKSNEIYQASNNPAYRLYKQIHPEGKLPSFAQHKRCSLITSDGCQFSTTRWLLPELSSASPTPPLAPPKLLPQPISMSANIAQASPISIIQFMQPFVSITLLFKFGFLNCLTRRCSRPKRKHHQPDHQNSLRLK